MDANTNEVQPSGLVPVVKAGEFCLMTLPSGRIWLARGTVEGMEIDPQKAERVLRDLWEFGF